MNNNNKQRETAQETAEFIYRLHVRGLDEATLKKETNSLLLNKLCEFRRRREELQQYLKMLHTCSPIDYNVIEAIEKEIDSLGGKIAGLRCIKGWALNNWNQ